MFQTLIICGNLGRDPEMRYLPNGNPVTSFSVATSRSYKGSNGEKVTETTWFQVSVFGKQAESCNKYLKKGSKVIVEGRLQADKNGGPRIWNDKSGEARASFEVVAGDVKFLSSQREMTAAAQDAEPEEIPF